MADQLNHTVTETITGDPTSPADQTINFYRAAKLQDDGSFEFSDWTTDKAKADGATEFKPTSGSETASFGALTDLHVPAGYNGAVTTTVDGQPTNDGSGAVSVTANNTTVARNVAYTAANASAHVVYVDQDNGNKQVGEETLSGQTGAAIAFDTADYLAKNLKGYEVVTDPTAAGATYDSTDDSAQPSQTFTVVLKHGHEVIDSTDPNALKTTYTVSYSVDDGAVSAPKANVQNAAWSSDKDLVTGVTTYTTTDKIASVTSPTLAKYKADKTSVSFDVPASTKTTPQSASQDVTYTRTTFTPSHPGDMGDQLNHTVTETITFGTPSTAATQTKTINFYRAAQLQDDGSYAFSDWTTDKATADTATDFSTNPGSETASFDALTDYDLDGYNATVATTIDGQGSDAGAGAVDVTANNTTVARTVSYVADNNGETTPVEPEGKPTVKTDTTDQTTYLNSRRNVSTPGSTTTTTTKSTANTLPQTDEDSNEAMAIAGIGMLSVLSMFGVAGKKRRHG
jgi:LPXTG-motif cell wall-anchored protein